MPLDYKSLGLKCGLEIHQQLDTGKLFCSCPSQLTEEKPDFIVRRELRAVAGEDGEVDIAAKQEQEKGKYFLYEGHHALVCEVELDEEPPHQINTKAMDVSLQVAKLLNAEVPSVIQVMRKTVVDGSNTSGFQRTALIARAGVLETEYGKIKIENISLEEDACRTVKEEKDHRIFRLDRLGIPLIEIGTAPDIFSPEQCREAAEKLGMILRSTGQAKRGLGTIRQDINISIKGGARIEIKGAQDLSSITRWVEYECLRQITLLEIKEELKRRALKKTEFKESFHSLSSLFASSPSKIIQTTLKNNGVILALSLPGFVGLIGKEVQPNRRLGTEFSERAKVKAGVGGIFHSDELPNYGITAEEVKKIRELLKLKEKDAFVLVCAEKSRAEKALQAVLERVRETFDGIPKEVRKANEDGTTSYQRPMPGASRMYPETDVPLIYPSLEGIALPELIEEKVSRFIKDLGLAKDLAENIAYSPKVFLFEELVKRHRSIKPAYIAETLTATLAELRRTYQLDTEKITDEHFKEIFHHFAEGKIHKDIMIPVLIDFARNQFNLQKYASSSTEELHKELIQIIKENAGANISALMGAAMKKLQGKASGKVISEMLKEMVKEGH